MLTTDSPSPGWYPDPDGSGGVRWWSGSEWGERRSQPPPPSEGQAQPEPQTVYVRSSNGIAVAALVCGIIAAVIGLIPILFIITLALGLVALVLGILGWRRAKREPQVGRRGIAIAGTVLGVIALALGIWGVVIVDEAVDDVDKAFEELEQSP